MATLPKVVPVMMMFAASMSNYVGLLSVALGVLGLFKIVAGLFFILGLFTLLKEHKGFFRRTA